MRVLSLRFRWHRHGTDGPITPICASFLARNSRPAYLPGGPSPPVIPVPVQMWAGLSPVPVQMWHGVSPVPVRMWPG